MQAERMQVGPKCKESAGKCLDNKSEIVQRAKGMQRNARRTYGS